MSLKAIHIIFIIASCAMTLFFGIWSGNEYFGPDSSPIYLVYLAISVVFLAALIVYARYFVKKLKHISYL
jgi:hypothetical protein